MVILLRQNERNLCNLAHKHTEKIRLHHEHTTHEFFFAIIQLMQVYIHGLLICHFACWRSEPKLSLLYDNRLAPCILQHCVKMCVCVPTCVYVFLLWTSWTCGMRSDNINVYNCMKLVARWVPRAVLHMENQSVVIFANLKQELEKNVLFYFQDWLLLSELHVFMLL